MSYCVLDASVALAWVLHGEATPATQQLLARISQQGAVVPALFPLEIHNVLLMSERRGRLLERHAALAIICGPPIDVEPVRSLTALDSTIALATTHRLSLYDAAYLELAQRRHLPLASLDRALRHAAKAAGIALLGHTSQDPAP